MTIFDRTMQLLERSLDLRGARQQVIAANIANEETPKYRATDLNFGQALANAQQGKLPITLVSTHQQHIGPTGFQRVVGRIEEVPAGDLPLDANSVNIELEMAKMSDNAQQYNTAATIISMRFRQLLSAIRDGR
jgi:flagellar basal-body rod protein FlgB